jgi:FkbM family methyltransferase
MKRIEERTGELIVTCGDRATGLETADSGPPACKCTRDSRAAGAAYCAAMGGILVTVKKLLRRAHSGANALLLRAAPSTKPYTIGEHTILLNREHLLPEYQSRHRLYDRFLPILCKQFDHPDLWIIDVGANVGDTAVAVAQACRNPILCIEGDDDFFDLLKHNVDSLFGKRERPVHCVKALAGSGRFTGFLKNDGTTAGLAPSGASGRHAAAALDDLLSTVGAPTTAIALIKVDTDGYDGDVILSARKILTASRPVIFWENYFATTEQMRAFEVLYQNLFDAGYRYFWVFDNYGNLMLRECSLNNIVDLNEYVGSQQFHGCTRSIFYTDVLAVTDDKLARARKAIAVFRSSEIKRE